MISVLVLDDDVDVLEMVGMVLTNHEMDVSCISKESELHESLEHGIPDVLLMDIYLGAADGRNLCRRLKTSEQFQHMPVILYSAGVITPGSIQNSLADEFLAKPFEIGELIRKIHSLHKRSN